MALQFITLKPFFLSPIKKNPFHIQIGNSNASPIRTQFNSSAAESVPVSWEEQIPPNALRRKRDPSWRGGFSLGVDLGLSRTGLALSKGFSVRPLTGNSRLVMIGFVPGRKTRIEILQPLDTEELLTVLELRGQKLELRLLDIAEQQEVDEFIIGLPKSSEGKETDQSNKVRSVAGRFAIRAAERGWRVYLQDEHGTSVEALDHMIAEGLTKSARQGRIDAYAAVKVLERYFSYSGQGTELVLPKPVELQNKLRSGPPKDVDFFPDE